MTPEEIYSAEQDHKEYQRLINTVEILTQAEYDFCFNWDHIETRQSTSNIGSGRYLNLNVYSEAEHDDRQYKMECGL
jgi:hypothetical protein